MVKIEIKVVETDDEHCEVKIGKPVHLKSATDHEKTSANAVHNSITKAISNLQ